MARDGDGTVQVTMRRGVVGEDGTDWLPGTTHAASLAFARHLAHGGRAVQAPGGDGPKTRPPAAARPARKRKP